MTTSSKAILGFMVTSLAALSSGCTKEGLTSGHTDAGAPPPGADAAVADLAPDAPLGFDVFVSSDDAKLGGDAAADAVPAADAATDTKPAADAATDTKPVGDAATDTRPAVDAASEGKPPVDAGNDKPLADAGDAAKDAPSACLWQDASVPIGGSVSDGCNTCACMTNGMMACTLRACPILDAGKDPCALPTAVAFGSSGGLVAYQDQYNLSPSTGLTVTRNYMRGLADGATVRTCAPKLPVCGAPAVVSVSTIVADLAAADVQAAFALTTTPIYGVDQRPVDGAIFSITLASGGTILVGAPCPSPVMNSCRPIPAGVQKLADDLKSLATAAAGQPACAGL
jgi:hypothetical protein